MAAIHENIFQDYIGRLTDEKLAEILASTRALFQQPTQTTK